MSISPDETYVQTYQKYLKQKGSSEEPRKATSSYSASTRVIKPVAKSVDCKICRVLAKPGDISRVLNQGLYHKYTSSQDYFYTRDINALLMKKRKSFCVRFFDDLIYDECKERLKDYFRKRDSMAIMTEIKQFYTQFKSFPRNFHPHFSNIINSNIRKHRRLEYIKVFNNVNLDEEKPQEEPDDTEDSTKKEKDNCEFNFMEMLGNSFLQDNYKDISGVIIGGFKLDKRRETEHSIKDLDVNFKELYKIPKNAINEPSAEPFSNALYNKNYMLYSRSDSTTAEDILKQIVNEFRDVDFSRKASVTLAEKVLHQVAKTSTKSTKKQENRCSPTLKARVGESSPVAQNPKKSGGSTSNFGGTSALQLQKTQSQPQNTSQRGLSNLRGHPQIETENTSILSKSNHSKLVDQKKSSSKFSAEHLNDLSMNRNKILSKLYQFRSTRSKSGGLKTMTSTTSKTPSNKTRRLQGLQCDTQGYDSLESKQIKTTYYIHEKSPSPSPDRKPVKEEADKGETTLETVIQSKTTMDPTQNNSLKRSVSQGLTVDIKEVNSPTNSNSQANVSVHKKSSSLAKRGITPKKQKTNTMVQNFMTTNTSGSTTNVSNYVNQENPGSPTGAKFINPLRSALGASPQYYFRHQSPLDEKASHISGIYHKIKSEAKIKNLNIRALKNTSPKRIDNYRVNTMSMSGRHQNILDLSQGISSFACNQTSFQMSKTSTHNTTKKKKVGKAEAQAFGPKITKRASAIQNQILSPGEEVIVLEREKKGKKALELSDTNLSSFKDLKISSKDQTPSNFCPSSTTSLTKLKLDLKKNGFSSYTLKASTKDLRMNVKK